MTDIDSRHVLPGGYDPARVTEPPAIPAEALAALELAEAHEELGLTRMLHEVGALSAKDVQVMLAGASGKVGRALRLLTGGALVLALTIVGLVAGPGAGRAEAMEAPQPNPSGSVATAPVYPVLMDRVVKGVPVPVVSSRRGPDGLYCASVVRLGQPLGRSCSSVPWFTVTAWLDARTTPLGRVVAYVVDDATGASVPIVLHVRRPSRFGTGTWTPTQYGDGLTVYATLYALTPALGRYTPQQFSPVQVQELRAGRWVTVARGTTSRYGRFLITVIVGGGPHTLRVHRDAGASVAAVNGTPRPFYLVPTDVPDGVI